MLKLVWNSATLTADLEVDGKTLADDDGLETAVVISLFVDARCSSDDDHPGPNDDLRGWWADKYADKQSEALGSKLWLLQRRKTTADVLRLAKSYAEDALAWMVRDGVASSVEATAARVDDSVLGLRIVIVKPSDGSSWSKLWEVHLAV